MCSHQQWARLGSSSVEDTFEFSPTSFRRGPWSSFDLWEPVGCHLGVRAEWALACGFARGPGPAPYGARD